MINLSVLHLDNVELIEQTGLKRNVLTYQSQCLSANTIFAGKIQKRNIFGLYKQKNTTALLKRHNLSRARAAYHFLVLFR